MCLSSMTFGEGTYSGGDSYDCGRCGDSGLLEAVNTGTWAIKLCPVFFGSGIMKIVGVLVEQLE